MLLAAYFEMFHGSILLNCLLRGCIYFKALHDGVYL